MNRWHRIAFICGLLPFLAGTTIFAVWLLTRLDWLILAGYFTIIIGLLLFVGGLVSIFVATRKAKQQATPYKRKNLLILVVLLLNFPVAMGMASYALHLMTIYDVLIINELEKPIDQIVFTDPVGKNYPIYDVPPHSQTHHEFNFDGEGSVNYQIKSTTIEQSGILIGYITSSLGGHVTVKISSDGTISVNESLE